MNHWYRIQGKVKEYIEANNMLKKGDLVVAGVSGGADSMCLLDILLEMKSQYELTIIAAHIHHGIRGIDADEDMKFVEKFCADNGIKFEGIKYDIPLIAKNQHMSTEEAGRIKRYDTFEQIIRENGGNGKIAVAHNMNDNSETFLLNLFRGTGSNGLSGIKPVRGNIIRPVMCLSRDEILEYLEGKSISYRTDVTNDENDYTRNKIRNDLMPYVTDNINSKAMENINRAAIMLRDINEYVNNQGKRMMEAYGKWQEDGKAILLSEELWSEDRVMVAWVIRRALEKMAGGLKDISAKNIEDIEGLGTNQVSKSVDIPYGIRAVRRYEGVWLTGVQNDKIEKQKDINFILDDIITSDGGVVAQLTFSLEENKDIDLRENLYTKWMDYDILKGSLSVRNRKSGDYMVIGENGHKKKLKDLLIDLKIPREERDKLVLLTKGSEILWIVGSRMSESVKINSGTTKVVRVDYRC